ALVDLGRLRPRDLAVENGSCSCDARSDADEPKALAQLLDRRAAELALVQEDRVCTRDGPALYRDPRRAGTLERRQRDLLVEVAGDEHGVRLQSLGQQPVTSGGAPVDAELAVDASESPGRELAGDGQARIDA